MARKLARLLTVEDLPPREVEVEVDHHEVTKARKALRDTGTVKVRDKEGDVMFYCLSVREYRRLKALDAVEG